MESVFEGLWQTEYFTHAELVEMAQDTIRVMERAVEVEEGEIPDVPTKTHVNAGVSLSALSVSDLFLGGRYGRES